MQKEIENYRLSCQKIIRTNPIVTNRNRVNTSASQDREKISQPERLSFIDIANITRTLFKDKKAHQHNSGVMTTIKGKMYCLKLGQVGQQKELSHYFYTTQFRKKQQKKQEQERQLRNMGSKKENKMTWMKKIVSDRKTQSFCESNNLPMMPKNLLPYAQRTDVLRF